MISILWPMPPNAARRWNRIAAVMMTLLWTGCSSPGGGLVSGSTDHADVTVNFRKAEQYRDLQLSGQSLDDSLSQVESTFASVLQQASNRLPAKSKLVVTFTEIDLAGWIPPGAIRQVRVVSAAYPAHLEFDYTLTTQRSGQAREQSGHADLSSFNEDTAGDGSQSQPLYLESKLLRNWIKGMASKALRE